MSEPTFERFPLDAALYRLVSAGKVAPLLPNMATARVRLVLVKIDDSDPTDLKWAYRASGELHAIALEEAAGSLPKLVLGSFWRDRTIQYGLSMRQDISVKNTLIPAQQWKIVRANDALGNSKRAYIPADEYPMKGEDAAGRPLCFDDAPLLRCVTRDGRVLLIPCYEVFRRFYGLTSELANAMISQHWKPALSELVDLRTTKVSEDGKSFEVTPLVSMRDIGCRGIALFMTMSTAARRAAEIFLAIENARRSGTPEPWILAYPPWDGQDMSLSFVGQELSGGVMLVHWIHSSRFPDLPYEIVRIDPKEHVPIDDPDVPSRPPPPSLDDRMEERKNATIRPAADARLSRSAVHFGLGEYWENHIKIKRKAIDRLYVPVNHQPDGEPPPKRKRRFATGRRSEVGSSPTASISSDTQNIILDRFKALAECFNALVSDEEIKAYEDFALVNPVQIGDRTYCAFPTSIGNVTRPWAQVDPLEPRPRLCWVSKITGLNGSVYYWLEVEAFPGEAFKALLMKPKVPGSQLTADTLEQVLKIGVIDKGQWKSAALLTVEEKVTWKAVRHQFASGRVRSGLVVGKLRSFRE